MKIQHQILQTLLVQHRPQTVLDLGAGRGRMTLYCTSFGASVDAVNNQLQPNFLFPEILTDHPLITFWEGDILDYPIDNQYDLIILSNVIMFMNKQLVLEQLLPQCVHALNPGGRIFLSFFYSDDDIIISHPTCSVYTLEDFTGLQLDLEHSEQSVFIEDHPPIGPHKHHIHYLVYHKSSK